MKYFLFSSVFLGLIASTTNLKSQKIIEIKAPISAVKVCLNSAIITHTQKINVKSGKNKIAFVGLATNMNGRNINLRNIGNAEILSLALIKLNDTTNLLNLTGDISELIKKSKDSLLMLEKNIEKLTFEIEGLHLERNMLVKNDDIIPNAKQISLAEYKLTSDYYRDRYSNLGIEIANKQRLLKQLRKQKIKVLKSSFDVENSDESATGICVVIAEINNSGNDYSTDIELAYIANESGWIPMYDISANDNKSLEINYRAKILNKTGIDWSNMSITLSTADPYEYYSAPTLEPFYVTRYGSYNSYNKSYDDYNQQEIQQQTKQNDNEEEILTPEREITFKLTKNYSIKSGKTPIMVDVTNYKLNPTFSYRTAPKLSEQVFAIAKISDWEKLYLIDGEASIFNNGSFLGKCYIKPSSIEDELELPLGVVDYIYIKHKLVGEFSNRKAFSGGTTATYSYEIKIKNNSTDKINIEVLDQVPVSESSSVKTEVIELTEGGDKDNTTGVISWPLELNGNSEKTLNLKYAVSYPRGYSFGRTYKKRAVRAKF